jgi:ubiquinone/menaquinone biosynthesis C-methylase UbiE
MNEINAYYTLTRRAFDFLAPVYNFMTLPLVRVRDRIVDFANARPGSLVLDVATGTGQQAFAFAKRDCDVTAVDLTESMLNIARKHNKDFLVKFESGDATHLRFEANSFDITCISFALHDMPLVIREQVLCEMLRVTKVGGTVVIVDYDLPRNKIGHAVIFHLVTLYEGEYYKKFIASDLDSLLRTAGIGVVKKASVLFGAGRIVNGVKKA